MTGLYATAIIVLSLIFALWSLVLIVRNLPQGVALVVGGGVLELLLIGFLIGGIVQMIGSDRDFARAEFVAYLIACVVLMPAAFAWGRSEQSRAGIAVIAVAFMVMPVLIVRVQQVWAGASA